MAIGCRFRVAARSRPPCRAGVHARREGLAASRGFRADGSIVPPPSMAIDCRFRVASRSRPQCRAGVHARREGLAVSQGFRDDASIVPYEARGKALPGFAGYLRRKAAMHPSVCAFRRIHLPLQGRLCKRLPPKRLPCKGSCRRQPTEGCRTLPGKYPSGLPQTSQVLRHYRALRCGACTKPQHHPAASLPGGRNRPPYNARQTGGTTVDGRHGGWMTVVECRPPA